MSNVNILLFSGEKSGRQAPFKVRLVQRQREATSPCDPDRWCLPTHRAAAADTRAHGARQFHGPRLGKLIFTSLQG